MKQNGHSFIESLQKKYESFKAQESTVENLVESIDYYKGFIPEFFSKNGEATGIRNMYRDIHDMTENGKEASINCADIDNAFSMYTEYVDGMIKFINDIRGMDISDDSSKIEVFSEKFKSAQEKDHIFIESLYNGSLGKKEDMALTEAVSNIEFLIDFIPSLDSMKSKCCVVKESVEDVTNETQKDLLNGCISMLCESVNDFCYQTINTVIDTYNKINIALESTDDVQKIKHGMSYYTLF